MHNGICPECGSPISVWLRVLLPVVIALTGFAAFANSYAGAFVFDDRYYILTDRRLQILWPPWDVLSRTRPLVEYSFAVEYALWSDHVWGYHAVNAAVHVLAAITLYGLVRRTVQRAAKRSSLARASTGIAAAVALLWVAHPLQTESVTYLVQRAESLMGLFYLLTLYCFARAVDSSRRAWWYAASVACCAAGMGSKAVMITAPAVVLAYDLIFVSRSLRDAMRRRWLLYVFLIATCGILTLSGILQNVLNPGNKSAHVGFGYKGVTPWAYLLTQAEVLVLYLKLSFWPHPLCLDYYWPTAHAVTAAFVPGVIIMTLLGLTLWGLKRRHALSFLGVFFFFVLAPTSSFVPIKDAAFEHRMYLPLAAVVTIVVLAAHATVTCVAQQLRSPILARSARPALAVLAVVSLGLTTVRRNEVYHSRVGIWEDVRAKRPDNPRGFENLGIALLGDKRTVEALQVLEQAVVVNPNSATAYNSLGFARVALGRLDDAIDAFRTALRIYPTFARANYNLGNAYSDEGRVDDAIVHFQKAIAARPYYTDARLNLGNAFLQRGNLDAAIEQYRGVLALEPEQAAAWRNLGAALVNQGNTEEALRVLRKALALDNTSPTVHNTLAIVLAATGRRDESIAHFQEAVRLDPSNAGAHFNLAGTLHDAGDLDGAVRHYRVAIQLAPNDPRAYVAFGLLLEQRGEVDQAIEAWRRALSLDPNNAEARAALRRTLERP